MPADDRVARTWGVLSEWDDDRGFGFITTPGGRSRVFVHISEFPRGRRPVRGCQVAYVESRDDRDRPRAAHVQYLTTAPASGVAARGLRPALGVATLFLVLLLALVAFAELPAVLLVCYGLASGVSVLLYGADKSAAEQGRWRTPESTLHAVALVGGWPGALVAQQAFRHKTRKQPFRAVFWGTVAANCAGLAWLVIAAPLG